jgi:phage-related tail protein
MKQRQAHYQRMATQYAEREQLERDKRASFMQQAVREMRFVEKEAQWLEEAASERGHLRELRYSEPGREVMASMLSVHNEFLALGRETMESADKAKNRAEFFSKLRKKYEKAGSSLWSALLEGSPEPGPIEMGDPR